MKENIPDFDPREFDELADMIGEDGVREMIMIFEVETRDRLRRLGREQDMAVTAREMHTLKGAAGTVAAPRLTAIGLSLEKTARQGIAPRPEDLSEIQRSLEAFLSAAHAHTN